jgi:hypothetical protein
VIDAPVLNDNATFPITSFIWIFVHSIRVTSRAARWSSIKVDPFALRFSFDIRIAIIILDHRFDIELGRGG